MTVKSGLEACYEAFERLKEGKPNNSKFFGIAPSKLTPSIVSQEAGFDSGYLKRKRPNHQGIISLIDAFKEESKDTTLSKAETIRRESRKANYYKDELERVRLLLEHSLARELLLATKLRELEKQLYDSNKVIRIDPSK
ncbi:MULTISPECIES: hypothetical protein [Vibrio]|uniref:hypothetical protein n=1 Tax=Vibrio TaxID=662 RepID=UPI002074ADD5|nr:MULTISPECIES: hypothetical protein [Vibrio]USD32107.1 hypothetical protein J8Z27_12775 [Vibrio sp. SCSIO 43186]USD35589.1 hypothetical protein J8Z27_22515 [Vibrio sp. SCSIO 43186]USD45149.1 hypothetical protein J4N38_13165 [Vibrio sp. SCSIO 43145]USD69232.1 hypothetical protein J4N41_12780 [Vibrio sp. SCSIO 43139]USD72709.1 hypothetical protein J4N41_22510 [Vibrio sp. SCSIO 43139]